MAKFFLRIGNLNKSLIIPFLLAISTIITNVFNQYYPEEVKNQMMDSYSIALGEMTILVIPRIKYFSLSDENYKETKACTKKNCCHYFLLLFLYTLDSMLIFGCSMLNENYDSSKSILMMISENLSTREGLEIVFITVTAMILLKYRYFIHHYLSVILFLFFSVAIDLIIDSYSTLSNKSFLEIFLNILSILAEVIYLCYIKYMIDRLYHRYWSIMFAVGAMLMVNDTLAVIAIFMTPKDQAVGFMSTFWEYFEKVPAGIIISKFIINYFLQFISSVLRILTIFYLSPEFILITQNLGKIFVILVNGNDNKYICIIFFILQFFSLMVYLEIIELNFLNLNKNTRKAISGRTNDDFIGRKDSYFEGCELQGGYIVQNIKQTDNDELKVELKQYDDSNKYNQKTN